jgi:hypothetical protein
VVHFGCVGARVSVLNVHAENGEAPSMIDLPAPSQMRFTVRSSANLAGAFVPSLCPPHRAIVCVFGTLNDRSLPIDTIGFAQLLCEPPHEAINAGRPIS